MYNIYLTDKNSYAKTNFSSDAGIDIVAINDGDPKIVGGKLLYVEYDTGIVVEPVSHSIFTMLFPRSSISKTGFVLCNSIGLIDNGYRGTIRCRFAPTAFHAGDINAKPYKKGDRIAQIVPISSPIPPQAVEITKGTGYNETTRGTGGFGSTGN